VSSASGEIDWGVNANGWVVYVYNNSPFTLTADSAPPAANVYSITQRIGPNQGGTVNGQPSIFGGPANMNFSYNQGSFRARISSDPSNHPAPDVTCTDYNRGSCDVFKNLAFNAPIPISVHGPP
jgi:hypothetical protein